MPRALVDIRDGERRGVRASFITLFGLLAGHTLIETARDALFLEQLPVEHLPWVYLAIAALAVGFARLPARRRKLGAGCQSLAMLLTGAAAVSAAFYFLVGTGTPSMLYVLYVFSGLFGTLAAVQFWIVVSGVYTSVQARRLYGFIGAGSVFGALAGAGLAWFVTVYFEPRALLLASSGVFVLTALGGIPGLHEAEMCSQQRPKPRERRSLRSGMALLRREPYLGRVLALVALATVTVTLLDYVFKDAVAATVPAAALGEFFSGFYFVANLAALVVQVFLVGWALRTVGLQRVLLLLPVLLVFGAAGMAAGAGLLGALALKGTDGALRHTSHRTSVELLFVPLDDATRRRARPLVDVVGHRASQAVASLAILGALAAGLDGRVLAASVGFLALLWVGAAYSLRGLYLELFRSQMRQGRIEPARAPVELDLGALESLFAALNSADDDEVVAALELLHDQRRTALVPGLILHHPSQRVVVRSLELFAAAGRKDIVPVVERLLRNGSPALRAAALRALLHIAPSPTWLTAVRDDPDPVLRATAVTGLVALVDDEQPTARAELDVLVSTGSQETLVAVAGAIEARPHPVFESALLRMGARADPEVRRATVAAMAAQPSAAFLPVVVPMLAHAYLRTTATRVLLAVGYPALAHLDVALRSAEVPPGLRRHIPRTMGLFSPAKAVPLLLAHVRRETDPAIQTRLLRTLRRVCGRHPDVVLEPGALNDATRSALRRAYEIVALRHALRQRPRGGEKLRMPAYELLLTMLDDRLQLALQHVLRLLDLMSPGDDLRRVRRAIGSSDPAVRASSLELVANVVPPAFRDSLLALLDDLPDTERLERGKVDARDARGRDWDYRTALTHLLDEGDDTVQSLAVCHVGEAHLDDLRPRLDELGRSGSDAVREAVRRAWGHLAASPLRVVTETATNEGTAR